MKIKMLKDVTATANESGNASKLYKEGEIVDCIHGWQKTLAEIFLTGGHAMEIKVDSPSQTKAKKKVVKKKTAKKSK